MAHPQGSASIHRCPGQKMTNPSREAPRRRILVVDNDPAIHRVFSRILVGRRAPDDVSEDGVGGRGRSAGRFAVDSARRKGAALDKLRSALAQGRPYALAFVDLSMVSGVNGVDTLDQLWGVDPMLHIVVCGGYSDCRWSDVLCGAGFRERLLLLRKPFGSPEVLLLARVLTKKWSTERTPR
jgi:CheY-like chemotaxis protein